MPLDSANVRSLGLLPSRSPCAMPITLVVALVERVPVPHCGVQPLDCVNWNPELARVAVLVNVTDQRVSPMNPRLVFIALAAVQPLISPCTYSACTAPTPSSTAAPIARHTVFILIDPSWLPRPLPAGNPAIPWIILPRLRTAWQSSIAPSGQPGPPPAPAIFPHCGKLFSMLWKKLRGFFHAMEKIPERFPCHGKLFFHTMENSRPEGAHPEEPMRGRHRIGEGLPRAGSTAYALLPCPELIAWQSPSTEISLAEIH
jgi:hypothetical protein